MTSGTHPKAALAPAPTPFHPVRAPGTYWHPRATASGYHLVTFLDLPLRNDFSMFSSEEWFSDTVSQAGHRVSAVWRALDLPHLCQVTRPGAWFTG